MVGHLKTGWFPGSMVCPWPATPETKARMPSPCPYLDYQIVQGRLAPGQLILSISSPFYWKVTPSFWFSQRPLHPFTQMTLHLTSLKKNLRFPRMISTNFLFWYLQTYVSSHHLLSSGFLPIPSFLLLSLTLLVTVPSSLIFNLYVLSISFPLAMNSSSVFPVFVFLILTNTCLLNPVDVCSSYCPAHPCCVWYNLSTVFSWRVFGSEKGWSMPLGFLLLSP